MADISLLFDVAGGGSISGESGREINNQLSAIVSAINAKPFEIKFKADTKSISEMAAQIQKISKTLEGTNSIHIDASGISGLTSTVQKVADTLSGSMSKSLNNVDKSLDSVSADLKLVRDLIDTIGHSLPQSGSAMEKMLQSGSAGVDNLVDSLRELRDILSQINGKEFNVSNVFNYTKHSQAGADEIELYRAKAYEALEVVKKLDSEFSRVQKSNYKTVSSAVLATGSDNEVWQMMNDYLSVTSSSRKAGITKAKSVGELTSIIKQYEEYAKSYENILRLVNEQGMEVVFPDTSNLSAASKAIDDYHKRAQKLEDTFAEAAQSAAKLNDAQADAINDTAGTIETSGGTESQYVDRIKKMCSEIDTELTSLRSKIESVFDFSTLTVDTSKIKSALDEVKQEFDITSSSVNTPSGTKKVTKKPQSGNTSKSSKTKDSLLKQAADTIRSMESVRDNLASTTNMDLSGFDRVIANMRTLRGEFESGAKNVDDYKDSFASLTREFADLRLDASVPDTTKEQLSDIQKIVSLSEKMRHSKLFDTSAKEGDIKTLSKLITELGALEESYTSGKIGHSDFTREFERISHEYNTIYKSSINSQKEESILLQKKKSLMDQILAVQTKAAKLEKQNKNRTWDTKDADDKSLTDNVIDKAKSLKSQLEDERFEKGKITDFEEMARVLSSVEDKLGNVIKSMKEYALATATVGKESAKAEAGVEEYEAAMKRLDDVTRKTDTALKDYSAAKHGKSSGEYNALKELYDDINSFTSTTLPDMLERKAPVGDIVEKVNEFASSYEHYTSVIKKNGEAQKGLFEKLGALAGKFTNWFGIVQVLSTAFRWIRSLVGEVIELDSAMTELKKVTDETEATYDKFLTKASQRSRNLGASLADTVNATADFTRLGYSIEEAEAMADAAIVYKTVGDGIEDINEASESIIATMQAFGDETLSAMGIVDKFNNVGNNFAISSKGIGEALLRSAAAMSAANNTIDETIALVTASNTVVQDPQSVGKCLPNNAVMYWK